MPTHKLLLPIKRSPALICMVVFFVLLIFGCSKVEEEKAGSGGEREKSPVVAGIGESTITVEEFKSYLSQRPVSSRSGTFEKDVKERMDALILEEVLYQEALSLKLDQDPEIRGRIRQMLIQKLLDEQMKRQVWNREIEEAEIHEYYRQHWEEFNRPEQVRVADIYIAVPADATEEHKVGLRRKAETALSEALGAREKRSGFATLIDKYSDSHERYRKGDTGFFDMEGKPVGIDGKLAEEAFKLERVGSISEQVIETPGGCHIIMLTGKRAAIQRPLDSVRNELIRRIQREAAAKARRGYIQRVKEKAQIQIGTEHMTAILEELKSQAKEALPTSSKIPVTPGSKDAPEPFQGKKRL